LSTGIVKSGSNRAVKCFFETQVLERWMSNLPGWSG